MEKFKPTNIKGAADTLPEVQILRNHVTDTLRKNFEAFGFAPIETAMVNYLEVLAYKYDADAEIMREIYKIKDQGERDLGLRFDLTIPFAKFIATNRNLKMPFRRYEIGRVWRNGPVKAGRLREFYQCDVDIVGTSGQVVEAELIALAVKSFLDLGIEPVIKYGNRKVLIGLIEAAIGKGADATKIIPIIDKIEKVSKEELVKELQKHMSKAAAEKLLTSFEKPPVHEEVTSLQNALKALGIDQYCVYSPSLARGLNYYTSTIWEVFDKKQRITSSLSGGGRYDNIITEWVGNGQNYPAVGLSFGLEPIMAVLNASRENMQDVPKIVDILVLSMNTLKESHKLAMGLRDAGIKVLTMTDVKPSKVFEYADKENIPFVTVVGERECADWKIKIKNMKSGEEKEVGMYDFAAISEVLK